MSSSKNVLLINAAPAKVGGAKSIIEKFLQTADFTHYDKVYVIAPIGTNVYSKRVNKINLETEGVYSLLFTTFFIFYYVIKLRATHLISFNNVNMVIPFCKRVTYFHTPHIFYSDSIRHKVLRFFISKFMKGGKFVFQSKYVENEFTRVFGDDYTLIVNWCGCDSPEKLSTIKKHTQENIKCIVPIMSCKSQVKNFQFILQNLEAFKKKNITLMSLDVDGPESDYIQYIGRQEKSELLEIYNQCDLMVMPSLYETVGLPIFEFGSTGKPVLVLDKPYLKGIDNTVGLTSNIVSFTEESFTKKLDDVLKYYSDYCIDPLDENHPLVKPVWNGLTEI